MIDGVHFADHVILVALGIDSQGRQHVLGLPEGATEGATACRALLVELRERGLSTDRSILVALDGRKALRRAVLDVPGDFSVIQRCQVHETRIVEEQVAADDAASVPHGKGRAVPRRRQRTRQAPPRESRQAARG